MMDSPKVSFGGRRMKAINYFFLFFFRIWIFHFLGYEVLSIVYRKWRRREEKTTLSYRKSRLSVVEKERNVRDVETDRVFHLSALFIHVWKRAVWAVRGRATGWQAPARWQMQRLKQVCRHVLCAFAARERPDAFCQLSVLYCSLSLLGILHFISHQPIDVKFSIVFFPK